MNEWSVQTEMAGAMVGCFFKLPVRQQADLKLVRERERVLQYRDRLQSSGWLAGSGCARRGTCAYILNPTENNRYLLF